MADGLAGTLIRVSVAAGTRRVDLALPGAVPVAELVPELARGLGILHAGTAHAGYTLVRPDGRRLGPALGLGAQEVTDGDLLTLVAGVEGPAPRRYDDLAEALGDAVERETERWRPDHGRLVRAVGGGVFAGLATGLGMPSVGPRVGVPIGAVLVAALLTAGLLPRLALALTGVGARAGAGVDAGTDATGARSDARLAHRILTGLSVAVGLLLLGGAPALAGLGRWGIALAVLACTAVLLGVRHAHAYGHALAGCVLGIGALAATAVVVLRLHPSWRPELAGLLAVLAAAVLAVRAPRAGGPASPRWAWLGDLVENAVLLALAPALVVASGLLDRLPV